MSEAQFSRRLAAILAADVVGYTRLMQANEERTLTALRERRQQLFDPTVTKYGGHLFKTMGDGFLVEFGSILNAARCAVEIQRGMEERNSGVPEDRHLRFRIGINLGDVIVDGGDFFGDGVNLAARLEGLARPGGIACSEMVRNEVGSKLELEFTDQGEKQVKNVAHAIRVYFLAWGEDGSAESGAVHVVAAAPPIRLHDKPSVAVLPFSVMGNDPEQEFFSDGITEDMITDLSKVSGLFVISRNTVFAYKGKALNLAQIARELGVAYLVQGSVRQAGNRVRISAQLIEGSSDGNVWAERYDRDLTDIFAVQDEITKSIVEELKVRLLPHEKEALEHQPTNSIEAYTHYLRGRQLFHSGTKQSLSTARQMFHRASELDPSYARAYAGIADCESRLYSKHGVKLSIDDVLSNVDRALSIDLGLAEAHAARGYALMVANRREEAVRALERALALDPGCHEAHYHYADFCVTAGDFERAAQGYIRALELKPDDYISPVLLLNILRTLGRREEADAYARLGLKRAEEALLRHPENSKPAQMGAAALATLGEGEKAREWIGRALTIDPDDNGALYNAACVYSLTGEIEKSIDLLERYLQQVGPDLKLWFKNDSDLDPVRTHPRYQRLLELAQ
jgi:adenylate cyclase